MTKLKNEYDFSEATSSGTRRHTKYIFVKNNNISFIIFSLPYSLCPLSEYYITVPSQMNEAYSQYMKLGC